MDTPLFVTHSSRCFQNATNVCLLHYSESRCELSDSTDKYKKLNLLLNVARNWWFILESYGTLENYDLVFRQCHTSSATIRHIFLCYCGVHRVTLMPAAHWILKFISLWRMMQKTQVCSISKTFECRLQEYVIKIGGTH